MTTITYNAPDDDAEIVTYMGIKFFNGQPRDVADALVIAKARKNPHFEVTDNGEDGADMPRKRGPKPRLVTETTAEVTDNGEDKDPIS